MTDLHTHILPGMDDGAANVRQSLAMLKQESEQGVRALALTPHYYPREERTDSFLRRRGEAWDRLRQGLDSFQEDASLPALRLGAEVAYAPGMWDWSGLPQLCYEGTDMLLVELPFTQWGEEVFRELHRVLSRRGITPMIAHLDRYLRFQKPDHVERLLDMGFPYQISASAIMHPLFWGARKLWLQGGVPISDCHDTGKRAPNLGKLQSYVCCKYGKESADFLASQTDILNQM